MVCSAWQGWPCLPSMGMAGVPQTIEAEDEERMVPKDTEYEQQVSDLALSCLFALICISKDGSAAILSKESYTMFNT